MVPDQSDNSWPPVDGREYIRSEDFARLLVSLARRLATRYPGMDFTDAVAQVFTWFDGKVAANPSFINRRRFRTERALLAYLRQSLWNAARLAERRRKRRQRIEALPVEQPIVDWALTPEQLTHLRESVDSLPEPHKTVLWRLFFEEDDLGMIASVLDRTEEEVVRLYEEAIDYLRGL